VTGHRDFDVQFPEHQLTLTPDGPPTWVVARIDGGLERFAVRPGQLTLLPLGQRIRGHTHGDGTRSEVRLYFEPEFVSHVLSVDIDPSRLELIRSMDLRNPNVLNALAALGRELEQPGLMGRAYTESLVLMILIELARHDSTLGAAPRVPEDLPSSLLRRVLDYMEAHLAEDLSLMTLAAEAGVSPARLTRAFRRVIGRSIHQHLLRRRIEWAAALLLATAQPIAHVALAVGFCSQAHLTTAFQRLYGTTPNVYRRQLGR
jgi:AraC family transcriptional regulator